MRNPGNFLAFLLLLLLLLFCSSPFIRYSVSSFPSFSLYLYFTHSLITLSARIYSGLVWERKLTIGVGRLVGREHPHSAVWHQFTTKKNYFPNLSFNELHFLNNVHHRDRPAIRLPLPFSASTSCNTVPIRWHPTPITGDFEASYPVFIQDTNHQFPLQLQWEMATLSVAHSFVLFVAPSVETSEATE